MAKVEFELYMGRAKLNLARHNFGRCKEDCLEALKWKKNEQIYFILVRSRYFIQKFEECITFAKEALQHFPNSIKIKELCGKAEIELQVEREHLKKVELINQGKEDDRLAVYRNLRGKGIKLGKAMHDLPQRVDQSIRVDKHGLLHMPVLVLYPEFMVTDFIQDWVENETFAQQLRPLFQEQAPWDPEGLYRMDTIEVYFEADATKCLDPRETPKNKAKKKYIRVNLKDSLLQPLQHPNLIVPQYPVFHVISRENDEFRDAFLGEI